MVAENFFLLPGRYTAFRRVSGADMIKKKKVNNGVTKNDTKKNPQNPIRRLLPINPLRTHRSIYKINSCTKSPKKIVA